MAVAAFIVTSGILRIAFGVLWAALSALGIAPAAENTIGWSLVGIVVTAVASIPAFRLIRDGDWFGSWTRSREDRR